MLVPGQTPVQFNRKLLAERNSNRAGVDGSGNPTASENYTTVPTTTIGGASGATTGPVMSFTGAGQKAHGSSSFAIAPPTRGESASSPDANCW